MLFYLDHRAEVFIPELGCTFKCTPSFRVFACQNPSSQGGGRKGLPKSFLNRFTKALEMADQVAGISVSTSPLPYCTMARHCEALDTGSRMKLSSWLAHETHNSRLVDQPSLTCSANGVSAIQKIINDDGPIHTLLPTEPWSVLRLPSASPFDNFLKATGCQGN
ncbi:hypothetical protein NE237_014981 [Protea cynaroides]|uniref:Uncharacterized protein n=1 Tax=Protea cynaroides TaxID=273540 RepID=A0A9Q0QQM6_9MAGN|nr:hypothetical protein NE237_014981 [Protea cynaroides]